MMLSNVLFWKKCFNFQFNRRVAQMLQCTCSMHHDAPFCNRNVHICAHFYYEICYVCLSGEFGDLWDGSISKYVSGIPIANVSALILDNGCPDNKFHGTNMGPIWGRQDPGGPMLAPCTLLSGSGDEQVSPVTLYPWNIWNVITFSSSRTLWHVYVVYMCWRNGRNILWVQKTSF